MLNNFWTMVFALKLNWLWIFFCVPVSHGQNGVNVKVPKPTNIVYTVYLVKVLFFVDKYWG